MYVYAACVTHMCLSHAESGLKFGLCVHIYICVKVVYEHFRSLLLFCIAI